MCLIEVDIKGKSQSVLNSVKLHLRLSHFCLNWFKHENKSGKQGDLANFMLKTNENLHLKHVNGKFKYLNVPDKIITLIVSRCIPLKIILTKCIR